MRASLLSKFTLLLLCAGLLASPPSHAEGAADQALVRDLLEATGAEPADCPDGLDAYGTTQDAICATTTQPSKAVKKRLRAAMRRRDDIVPVTGSLWRSRHEYELATFFVGPELFVLRFDARDGGLAFMPNQSCFRPATLERAGVVTVRETGVTAPEPAQSPRPEYPAAARAERQNGFAMVQVVVSPDGSVSDACVLYVTPEGLGFREEAQATASRMRFRPGTLGDAPARVLVNQSLTWEIR